MRKRNATILGLGIAAVSMTSCSADPPGQVILVLQTDMSLPKDVDRIRVVVTDNNSGGTIFAKNYDEFIDPQDPLRIRLPGTVSIVANESDNRPIRVKVLAFRGVTNRDQFVDPNIRVIRDVVMTLPQNRAVTLPVPIEFLCDGMAQFETDASGAPMRNEDGELVYKSTCGNGLTCKAGKCVTEEVKEEELGPYNSEEIFGDGTGNGDGTCFDTGSCFDGATGFNLDIDAFDVDGATCLATVPDGTFAAGVFNVGLETQGSGMCNSKGCYIALNAASDSGWKLEGTNTLVLPSAVCEKYKKAEIARVIGTPAGPRALRTKACIHSDVWTVVLRRRWIRQHIGSK